MGKLTLSEPTALVSGREMEDGTGAPGLRRCALIMDPKETSPILTQSGMAAAALSRARLVWRRSSSRHAVSTTKTTHGDLQSQPKCEQSLLSDHKGYE